MHTVPCGVNTINSKWPVPVCMAVWQYDSSMTVV